GSLPHRARDQAPFADARTDRSLPGDPQATSAVPFELRVVVVAVDLEGRLDLATEDAIDGVVRRAKHQFAITARVRLRPAQVLQVRLELGGSLLEPGQLGIGEE